MNVAWCIDLFSRSPQIIESQLRFLSNLGEKSKINVTPASLVWSRDLVAGSMKSGDLDLANKLINATLSDLKRTTDRYSDRLVFKKPLVVVSSKRTRRSAISEFVKKIEIGKFDSLAISTKNRAGLSRWLMGSFSEAVVLQTELPVLVTNPNSKIRKISKIFWPIDLAEEIELSEIRFVMRYAANQKAKVLIYHQILTKMEPAFTTGEFLVALNPEKSGILTQAVEEVERKMKIFKKTAESYGVNLTIITQERSVQIEAGIKRASEKKNASIIIMHSSKSRGKAFLLGSTSRNMIRISNIPIWVRRGTC